MRSARHRPPQTPWQTDPSHDEDPDLHIRAAVKEKLPVLSYASGSDEELPVLANRQYKADELPLLPLPRAASFSTGIGMGSDRQRSDEEGAKPRDPSSLQQLRFQIIGGLGFLLLMLYIERRTWAISRT